MAVKGDVEKVREALQGDPEVTLANWNSNDQVVIAGSKAAMARAQKLLTEQGFKTIPLPVSAAFHTPLVGHAQKPFAKAIKAATFPRAQAARILEQHRPGPCGRPRDDPRTAGRAYPQPGAVPR